MKNKAFTLAEVLIVLSIVGAIAVVMIKNVSTEDFRDRTNVAKAYKVINVFDQASASIVGEDKQHCPMGSFIYKSAKNSDGTYDYQLGLVNDSGSTPSASEVLNIFGKYLKYESTGLAFCSYSGFCDDATIPGVKLAGDAYAGVVMLNSVENCPNFYLPESGQTTVRTRFKENVKPQCWAKLYVDVNGTEGPNEEGKDVFILGLGEYGINR